MRMGRSCGNVVVTMKKMRSRKAMSASDDDGMSLDAFDFRCSPPPVIMPRYSRSPRFTRVAPATCSWSSTSIMKR
jgi:hypothetical protein